MSSTRDLARETAFEMLMEGTKPSVQKIREQIGQGSDKTILDGLNEFWVELGQLIQDWRTYPKLPDDLAKAMNEWWHLAMKQAHSSLDIQRKEMIIKINEAEAKQETALLEKQECEKTLENISQANDELTVKLNVLNEKYQIQLQDNAKIMTHNESLKKENYKLNQQIISMEKNNKEALKLSYDRAQETEQNYAKQIDSWKIQADKSQNLLLTKEKEWKKNNNDSLKKIEELYKQISISDETIQKKNTDIERLTVTADDKQKSIKHFTHQIEITKSSLASKDKLIEEQQTEINNLKEKNKTNVAKEQTLEESQMKLEKKFEKLLETINSKT
ncbi:MAG: DNA-binding protein [Gammaproteobacteria bacterium]|nr:DNA-binding protein [Gammaproteobacteria bacterium]